MSEFIPDADPASILGNMLGAASVLAAPVDGAQQSSPLWFASANVLTFDSQASVHARACRKTGLYMPGRMRHLGDAFAGHGLFMVGTQETRFPRSGVSKAG
eukprot:2174954-Pyramimonas_sp.AAC.1